MKKWIVSYVLVPCFWTFAGVGAGALLGPKIVPNYSGNFFAEKYLKYVQENIGTSISGENVQIETSNIQSNSVTTSTDTSNTVGTIVINQFIEKLEELPQLTDPTKLQDRIDELQADFLAYDRASTQATTTNRISQLKELGVAPGKVNLWLKEDQAFDLVDEGNAAMITSMGRNSITLKIDGRHRRLGKAGRLPFRSQSRGGCNLLLYEVVSDAYSDEEFAGLNLTCERD